MTAAPGPDKGTDTAAFHLGGRPVWPDANRVANRRVEPKSMAVLLALTDAAPAVVPLQTLIERVWKNVDVSDSVVHRAVSQLREALEDDARRPWCIETVPRRGYRLIAPIGNRDRAPDKAAATAAAEPLLAVFPFDNLSNDPDLEYFSDGVSEEILQTVARIHGLRVIGRASSFQFRGRGKSVVKASEALGCSHVLDGSVRRSGQRIRITAQLIECPNQTTLWNDRFDYALADVFELQDQVAAAVASALRLAFGPSQQAGPIDPETYELYLRARSSTSQWLGGNDAELLEQAVARAPSFAKAWAALALTLAIDAHVSLEPAQVMPSTQRAIAAARTALALDPTSSGAYVALSIVEPVCGRFAERDALIARAFEVSPNDPVASFWAGRWSWTVGRLREHLDHLTHACSIDPLWPQGLHQYATALWTLGQRARACDVWDRTMARWPNLPYLYSAQLGFATASRDWARFDSVRTAWLASGLEDSGSQRMIQQGEKMRRWQEADTQALLETLHASLARTGTVPLRLICVACDIGRQDDAYELLERADFEHLREPGGRLRPGDFGLHHLFSPGGRRLREDERFVALCTRLGLCAYWVKSGRWPDCAAELAPCYDFEALARRAVD